MVLRHTTVLIEIAGQRVLVDPCFAPGLGAGGVLQAPAPAVLPDELGPLDLVLVTSGLPGALDRSGYGALDTRRAVVLVPDEGVRRRVLRAGVARRVRVVGAGDVVRVGPLSIAVSPAQVPMLWPAARAVGFCIEGAGARVWHTGPLPPLDVAADAVAFATDHAVDVVLGVSPGVALRVGGPPWFAGVADLQALARLARARAVVPLGDDIGVAPLLAGVMVDEGAQRSATSPGPPLATVAAGEWLRVDRR